MSPVKDQLTLARAFIHCLATRPELRQRLRLVMVGDGPLRREAQDLLVSRGVEQLAWLPGARDDVPALLAAMDLFVLPSRNEGISNTILEAMASGLPVIATDVGGNGELVENSVTGRLVPPQSPVAIADAIADYAALDALRVAHGIAGRKRVEGRFSLERMVRDYFDLYEGVLRRRSGAHALGRAGES
jgi:glycosyltransferase involved in cell wall biosynthesis